MRGNLDNRGRPLPPKPEKDLASKPSEAEGIEIEKGEKVLVPEKETQPEAQPVKSNLASEPTSRGQSKATRLRELRFQSKSPHNDSTHSLTSHRSAHKEKRAASHKQGKPAKIKPKKMMMTGVAPPVPPGCKIDKNPRTAEKRLKAKMVRN